MRFLLRYVLIAFSFTIIPLYAVESFPVQVIDMGNTNDTVSLESDAKNTSTWFVSDKPVDPMAFSSQMLKGEKRKETTPHSFTPFEIPSNLMKLFGEKKVGETIWYYKSFIAPSNPRATLSLRLGKINDADEVYLNGILIGKSGSMSPFDHAWDKVRVYDIPSSLLRPLEKNIILIRVHVYFSNEYGIIRDHVQIGDSEIMNRELIVNDILVLVFLSCYLTFGLYFLFLFLRRPTEKSYLLFSLFIFTLVLYQFLQTQVKYYVSANFLALKRIEYLALFSIFPAFYFYLREFFQVKTNKVFRYIHWGLYAFFAVIVVLYGFVLLVDNPLAWTSWNERVYLKYIMPVLITVSFAIVVYKIFKRDKNARAIMVGLFFLLVTLVIDNLVYYGIINVPRVTSYVIFTFIMSLAFILANQFVRVHKQVEDLNRNLEKKVEERTHELRESLTRVQELKTQQDGDYFLTSLLIEPLSANRVESNYTKVQFFVKEKKEFSFRRWSRDIGGDMCIAHTVELRGRKFTIALNADAMGKSMQGAGGALVLGSVFASIIERTRSASIVRDSAPETWLRAAFMELNRVFESFDGSMLVSVVLAAIDDEAGVMYYINAEHPWSVIYRNGKAAFTDEDFMLRKLGTLVGNENIQVHVFYLEDNDVVIMGSDGRDDLILGIDHEGHRIINEDETLFLKHVEDAKADLPKLVETLKETGDLSDDLSFIRIEYHAPEHRRAPIRLGDSQAVENFKTNLKTNAKPLTIHDIDIILTRHQHNATEMHYAIRWLIQLKQYEKAGEWAEKFATEFPMETEFLYLAALGYKLAGRYGEALDFSERLFVRIASHEKNLINLVDLQILLKRKGDAENALSFLNKYFPHNEKIVKLKQALEQI